MNLVWVTCNNIEEREPAIGLFNQLKNKGFKPLVRISRLNNEKNFEHAENNQFLMCVRDTTNGNRAGIIKPIGGGNHVVIGNNAEYLEAYTIFGKQIRRVEFDTESEEETVEHIKSIVDSLLCVNN